MAIISMSGCSDATAAMELIAVKEFGKSISNDEPDFIGSAGDGTPIDLILSFYGQDAAQHLWEYYKIPLAEKSGAVMKAWLHWNGSEFDAYLKCSADQNGASGFTTHAMPYIQG